MEDIQTKFYPAGKDVLLILTGIGGSTEGYRNKYKTIGESAVKDHGFSVCVATTPCGSWEHPEENVNCVMSYIKEKMRGGAGKIYAMGNSAGATFLMWYAYLFPEIKKVLAVNPVLNINPHRTNAGVKNFAGEKIIIAAGENDASKDFLPFIKPSERLKTVLLKGIDHNFTNDLPMFISLPEKYLFCA